MYLWLALAATAHSSPAQEFPLAASRGRHTVQISEAGRVDLSVCGLDIAGLFLTATDSGGLVDQRPYYVPVTITVDDGDDYEITCTGTLTTRTGIVFDLRERLVLDSNGVSLAYDLTPRTDCTIDTLRLSVNLPVSHFAGRRVSATDSDGVSHAWVLPDEQGEPILGSAAMAEAVAEFGDGNGLEISGIAGPKSVLLWDMRGWQQAWYALDMRLAQGELKAGTRCHLEMRLTTRHELRDKALLGAVERAREAEAAHFLGDLRAEFRDEVLPVEPFNFADTDWEALRGMGGGLERIIPYVASVCDTIDMDPGGRLFGYADFHWRSGIAPDTATYVETMQPLACVWSTPGDANPHYRDPALMQRIEAMAVYYCELIGLDGSFGGPWSHPLARAAESYYRVGEWVDEDIADVWVDRMLRRAEFIGTKMVVQGQCTNQQAEGFHALQWTYWATGDERVLGWIDELKERYLSEAIQRPGYPVELQGPDYYYHTVSTMALYWYYELTHDDDIRDTVRDRIIPWHALTTLPEPPLGTGLLVGIRGHDTRMRGFARAHIPWIDAWARQGLTSARAFCAANATQPPAQATRPASGPMPELTAVEAVKRGVWRNYVWKLPDSIIDRIGEVPGSVALSVEDVAAARREVLACFRQPFAEHLSDDYGGEYLFTRREGYYAAASWGPIVQSTQRKGAGLQALWAPDMGTVLLSQNREGPSHELLLSASDGSQAYGSSHADPVVEVSSDAGLVGELTASWELKGIPCSRRYSFRDGSVEVHVEAGQLPEAEGAVTWQLDEVIPLMMDGRTELVVRTGNEERLIEAPASGLSTSLIMVRKAGHEVRLEFGQEVTVDIDPAAYKDPSPYSNPAGIEIARVSVTMPADHDLKYRFVPQ